MALANSGTHTSPHTSPPQKHTHTYIHTRTQGLRAVGVCEAAAGADHGGAVDGGVGGMELMCMYVFMYMCVSIDW